MHDKLWTEFPLGISLTLMVMDRIAGRTLTEWMESETPIAGKEIDATLEMLEAKISKLHDEGIVHGDLHTDNVMVTLSSTGATQRVWIVDYGHARIAESRSDRLGHCVAQSLFHVPFTAKPWKPTGDAWQNPWNASPSAPNP